MVPLSTPIKRGISMSDPVPADPIIGLDIGSRSLKMVRWENNGITDSARAPTTFDPLAGIRHLLPEAGTAQVVATGIGREVFRDRLGGKHTRTVSTIKALVRGARHLHPEARTVLDIGGLHTTVILLTEKGEIKNYETDSRCAAGTGKFLEFMATSMQVPLEDFGAFALQSDKRIEIEHSCTIFAESEAMFRVASGEEPPAVAMGLHLSHLQKTMEALRRVGSKPPLLFTGGVAHNPCIESLLREQFTGDIIVPENPDIVGALGAALHGVQPAET
jgi:predicted CoA-substrate-specific enzyme activase